MSKISFLFIVGQVSVKLKLITQEQYGLLLSAPPLVIVVKPLLFHGISWD